MKERYYELPRYVYTDEKYETLNHNARLLYAVVLDDFTKMQRFHANNPETSHFKDEQGSTYIALKREKLAKILNCTLDTITRLKKQLVHHGLLKEVRIGRNRPNRLYPIIPNDVTGKGFIKIPQCFFTEKRYKNMSSIAKIVYSCLDARFNMSKENDYKDRYGNVCCKYSYKSIISFLNCSRYAFKKAKDELLALDLMKQIKDNFSYSMHYYMKKPNDKVVTKSEDKEENQSKQENENLDVSGHDKIEPRDTTKLNRGDTTKLNQNYPTFIYPTFNQLSTNVKSVMNIKSASKETEHTNHKHNNSDKTSINQSVIYITTEDEKERYLKQYPEQIALALKPYTLKDAQNYMSIICNTKNQHNSEMGTDYSLEDMSLEIARTIDQVKRVMKRNGEKPEDMFGYLKVAILDCIEEFDIAVTLENLKETLNFNDSELKESESRMRHEKEERIKNKRKVKQNIA